MPYHGSLCGGLVMRVAFALCAAAFAALSVASVAQDLPQVHVLACETGCPKWVAPKPVGEHRSYFPTGEKNAFPQFRAEAFAVIRFTITPEGTVRDPVLEKLVGPQDFADNAIEAVKTWRYQPATADGVPTAANWRTEVAYFFSPPESGARDATYYAYKKAQGLIGEKKYDEAIAVAVEALGAQRLNFYEREMLSYLAALGYAAKGDYLTARDYAEDATLFDAKFLSRDGREAAMRLRVKLEALTGQFAEASAWYEKLKQNARIGADDSTTKIIAIVDARLNDAKPITMAARIPTNGYPPLWSHTLLRRHFLFPEADPGVDRLMIDCDRNRIESPISTAAEWHVPKSWSNCRLLVHGAPGAKFMLTESVE